MYNCLLTPEELSERLDKVIAFCEQTGKPATDYVVTDQFGISQRTLEHYREYCDIVPAENATEQEAEVVRKKRELGELIKKLDRYRNHFWQNKALDEPKSANMSIFALKQERNGGWTDRQSADRQAMEITVKMGGKESGGTFD